MGASAGGQEQACSRGAARRPRSTNREGSPGPPTVFGDRWRLLINPFSPRRRVCPLSTLVSLQLLLGAQLAFPRLAVLLAADNGFGVQAGVALAADLLVLVELLRKLRQTRINHATTQAQHQVQSRLCARRRARQGSVSAARARARARSECSGGGRSAPDSPFTPGPVAREPRYNPQVCSGAASHAVQHLHKPDTTRCTCIKRDTRRLPSLSHRARTCAAVARVAVGCDGITLSAYQPHAPQRPTAHQRRSSTGGFEAQCSPF